MLLPVLTVPLLLWLELELLVPLFTLLSLFGGVVCLSVALFERLTVLLFLLG